MTWFDVHVALDADEATYEIAEYEDENSAEPSRSRVLWSVSHTGTIGDKLVLRALGEALTMVAATLPMAIPRGLTGPRFIGVLAELASFILESPHVRQPDPRSADDSAPAALPDQ